MKLSWQNTKELLLESAREWNEDKASRLGAALAYYTIFSIAPLLLIAIAIAGFFFGHEAAQGTISNQISSMVGPQAGKAIETMVQNAGQKKGTGIFATIMSVVLLLFGASGVFVQLKDALNTVWDVPPAEKKGGVWEFLKTRVLSFGFVLGMGFLLLVSLVISTILSAAGHFVGGMIPMPWLLQAINFVVSLGVISVIFAMIFKFLPDIKLPWSDVWHGAITTAVLFTIGKWALGVYLGRSSMSSAYGAAGSLVVLLVWIYYSAQIAFFGAEMTQVYSRHYGAWRGRVKRTERQKAEGVRAGYAECKTEEERTPTLAEDPAAVIEEQRPNKFGQMVGKAIGFAVAGQGVAKGFKSKPH